MSIAKRYREVFHHSAAGKDVLDDLRQQFYDRPDIAGATEHATVVNAAQRDVVRYIIDLVEAGDDSRET